MKIEEYGRLPKMSMDVATCQLSLTRSICCCTLEIRQKITAEAEDSFREYHHVGKDAIIDEVTVKWFPTV